jgi:ADP-ribose pyrophosphatase
VISSDVVYRGRLFDVELDRLRFGNGIEANREILRHSGAVCMIPVAADGTIYFVTQYRHAAGRRLLELPAGTLEPGEDPADTAVRELQEEVGFRPGQVQPLGGFYVAPGYTSEYIHLFLCTELEASVLDGDDDEDIEIVALSAREAIEKIDNGEICDAKSIIGVLRWIHRDNG